MKPKNSGGPFDLDDRQAEVLKSIIREHVCTGEPVGSQRLAREVLDLSSASIRHVMAELEERDLLSQPHTSAGRVPTDKAYRLFVDQMLGRPRVAASHARAIDEALGRSRGEFPDVLTEASRQLSHFSKQVGVVMAPQFQRIVVDRLEFVRIDARRVVAILVARSGVVHNRTVEVEEALEQAELDRIGRYLSDELGGRTLPEMRELLQRKMSEEREAYDKLTAQSLELGSRTVARTSGLEENVIVEGASKLLESPEFADLEVARSLFQALEEKKNLIALLNGVLDGQGVQVVIGEENPQSDLARCSLVASSYGVGERVVGTVGIVGPMRMEYARAIALVDHLARLLSKMLTHHEN